MSSRKAFHLVADESYYLPPRYYYCYLGSRKTPDTPSLAIVAKRSHPSHPFTYCVYWERDGVYAPHLLRTENFLEAMEYARDLLYVCSAHSGFSRK